MQVAHSRVPTASARKFKAFGSDLLDDASRKSVHTLDSLDPGPGSDAARPGLLPFHSHIVAYTERAQARGGQRRQSDASHVR